jgi:hypothetical protein
MLNANVTRSNIITSYKHTWYFDFLNMPWWNNLNTAHKLLTMVYSNLSLSNLQSRTLDCSDHIISIPAYAIEQQWWQAFQKKNVINFQKWCSLFSKACHYVAFIQKLVDTPVNGRPSLFRIDSVHQMDPNKTWKRPRFVGLLTLSLWLRQSAYFNIDLLDVTL